MKKNQFSKTKLITAIALIAFGAGGRYLLQDIPNIETITVVSLLAGSLLGGVWTMTVGLLVVAITDMAIGNTSIMLYTWTAWAAMGVLGYALRKREKKVFRHSMELTGMGLVGTLLFYAWTNFGVWQLGGLYAPTMDGLMASYVAGIPFLRMQLLSTLVIVPSVSIVALTAWNFLPQFLQARKAVREYGSTEA